MTKWFLIIFLVIGVFLRFYFISNQSYWMDEGYTINAVTLILEKGKPILDSGEYYSCPIYCNVITLATKIFDNDTFAYRSVSAIAGSLLIIIIFFFSRRLFNTKVALWSAFFTAFSYFEIAWSRTARSYTLFALFFWLTLFFFYKYLYDQKQKILYLAMATGGAVFSILLHKIGIILPFILIGWTIFESLKIKKINWPALILLSIIGAVGIGEVLGWNIKLNFWFFNYAIFYLKEYLVFWLLMLALILFAKNYLARYKKEVCFLVLPAGIYFLTASIFSPVPQYRYLFHLLPAIFILGGVSIEFLEEKFKFNWQKVIFSIIMVILFLSTTGIYWPQKNYYLESDNLLGLKRNYYAYVPEPNWNDAYKIIKEKRKSAEIVISSQTVFNKIFLQEAGYWIKYPYLGSEDPKIYIKDDKEYYVGAKVIDDFAEFKEITSKNHGFIIFDFMALDNRIPQEILDYIYANFELIYYDKMNPHSQIWVYRF
ncbi:hypothetical protein A2645_01340 [Candidatus Nomurabacteria bacterium RIFCSPHIGHO2_01_FULL_39_9]|uniref:Glycosyltransferase RgtA/B/C/D-like domain-containing protein n=1 Tax=Candidatus Nomurabacteria bacterium RIFCSPHIGHO2_01_FULL_39_9 TaxID=1801735 RepID=A0A1F6UXU6_9BACT|nr:MAG: hypothetical protein A2645_01340 [Candidatus Nomurabacteria bacterium RIFCSPHIGHO2_01_FULL_39_9]